MNHDTNLLKAIQSKRDQIQNILEDNSDYFQKQCQQYHKDHIGELSRLQQSWKEARTKWFSDDINEGLVTRHAHLKEAIKERESQLLHRTHILTALKQIYNLHYMLSQFRNDFLSKPSSILPKDLSLAIKRLEEEQEQLRKDYPRLNIINLYKESIDRDINRCKTVLSKYLDTIFKLQRDNASIKIFIHQSWNIEMLQLIRKTNSESIFIPKIFDQWIRILRQIVSYDVLYDSLLTIPDKGRCDDVSNQLVSIDINISPTIKWSEETYLKLFRHVHGIFLSITAKYVLLDDKSLIKSFWKEYESESISLLQHLLIDDVLFDIPSTESVHLGYNDKILEFFYLLQGRINDHCANEHDHKDLARHMKETFSDPNFSVNQLPKMIRHVLNNTDVSQMQPVLPSDDCTDSDMSSYITLLYQNETARFLANEFDSETTFEFGSQSINSDELTDFYMQFASYKPRCSSQALYIISLMNMHCNVNDIESSVSAIKKCFQIYKEHYQSVDTWKNIPHLSCLLYSDCYFLAHRLIMMIASKFTNESAINILIQEAEQLICMGNESLETQNQQQKKFIQECLYEELDLEDLAELYRENCRVRVDHQLKRIRHHLLNMKKAYGMTGEQNILISRGAYVRSIGQCLNLVLKYIKDALIFHITDITEEDTHHFHALTLSITSWARELFHMDGVTSEIVYLKETTDSNGHMILELEHGAEDRLERQISFLPDWISFQHMSNLLEWSMDDIVHYSMYIKGSILEPYLLEKEQICRLITAIFSPSDMREKYISMLMKE